MATETKPGLTIEETSFAVVRDMGTQLLRDHWEEVATNKRLMDLDPDWDTYKILEDRHRLITLCVFDADRRLHGYSMNIVAPHLHYRRLVVAQNDVLFASKQIRGTRTGLRLITRTVEACKDRGAQVMLFHAKEDPALKLQFILPKMGYSVQDIMFMKEL